MKKIVFILISVFCMCCMVACGGEVKEDVSASSSNEILDNSANDQPVVTEAPVAEPEVTPAPAETPVEEATPAPTEEPSVVYEGIDMDSDLPIQTWIETFVGVIDEPKVVIFNNETGKKAILEQENNVVINPETDAMLLYFPEGYKYGNIMSGIAVTDEGVSGGFYEIYYFDSAEMREAKEATAGFVVMKGDEKVVLIFNWKVE